MPAWAVLWVLDDPRRIPYLLIWKSPWTEEVKEAVRVASYSEPPGPFPLDWTGWVEIKRSDKTRSLIRTIERPLPRNGGKARFVVCPYCAKARRALYGWAPGCGVTQLSLRRGNAEPAPGCATLPRAARCG